MPTHSRTPIVGDFMTPMPHAIEPHMSLAKAEERLGALKVLHLPVRAAGRVVGILSDRDVLLAKALPGVDPDKTDVAHAMTEAPYSVRADTPLAEVARTMSENRYGATLIVDDKDHLVGIFTTTDALEALAKLSDSRR
jgi:CBS domain-containing protein